MRGIPYADAEASFLGQKPRTMAGAVPPRIDEAAFIGIAGQIIRKIEPHTEADPSAMLLQLLIAFGNVVGRGPYIAVESTPHYPIEFVAIVGRSSKARKGTSLDRVLSLVKQIDQEWSRNRIASGLSSGEGLINEVRDDAVDSKGDTISGADDKRLLVVETEFASALAAAGRQGNKLSAILRDAWDGKMLRTLTKNTPLKATGAHISVIVHVTFHELLALIQKHELSNGFANRFLWGYAQRSKNLPRGGNLKIDDLAAETEELCRLAKVAQSRERIERDEDSWALWESVYPHLAGEREGVIGDVTSRAEAHVIRLALIYALLDDAGMIREQHLRAALAVWSYCDASAQFIFGGVSKNAQSVHAELLAAFPQELSREEIRRRAFKGHASADELSAAFQELVRLELATCRKEHTGGRPTELWRAAAA